MNPYPSAILNDLHHHFPDLLYRSERFQTIQDVLQYVIGVARESPYDRERRRYRAPPPLEDQEQEQEQEREQEREQEQEQEVKEEKEEKEPVYRFTTSSSSYVIPPLSSPPVSSSSVSTTESSQESLDPESILRALFQPRSVPRPASNRFRLSVPLSLSSFLSSSYSVSPPSSLQSLSQLSDFLRPVVIRPTEEQLAENTYVYRSEVAHQENCAICQDPMEAGQETRTILACSHCFHRDCIDRWFQEHVRCPTCRRDVREP